MNKIKKMGKIKTAFCNKNFVLEKSSYKIYMGHDLAKFVQIRHTILQK
jgi:hypothetical protein